MFEGNRGISVRVELLLKRQLDITTHRAAAVFKRTAVRRLHDTQTAARHGSKAHFVNTLSKFPGHYVIGMIFLETGRPKYGDAGANEMKFTEADDKLPENFYGKK